MKIAILKEKKEDFVLTLQYKDKSELFLQMCNISHVNQEDQHP